MEILIFESPKKYRITAIKKLLINNSIPISSEKLSINEELNDIQTFELYVDKKHENAAIQLIENINEETFFGDCIFKSKCYDEVLKKYQILKENNIPCDDIIASADEYILSADPEYIYLLKNMDEIIEKVIQKFEEREKTYKSAKPRNGKHGIKPVSRIKQNDMFIQESKENIMLKFILPLIVITICLFFIKIENESIIIIIVNKIKAIVFNS